MLQINKRLGTGRIRKKSSLNSRYTVAILLLGTLPTPASGNCIQYAVVMPDSFRLMSFWWLPQFAFVGRAHWVATNPRHEIPKKKEKKKRRRKVHTALLSHYAISASLLVPGSLLCISAIFVHLAIVSYALTLFTFLYSTIHRVFASSFYNSVS